MTQPILYSFRRCPYAMRARLAIASAGIQCEFREILLRDKPASMLAASPKGTVPVVIDNGTVIDESLDIMNWALGRNDPEGWLDIPDDAHTVIGDNDGPFKSALDKYKYASRYEDVDGTEQRDIAAAYLMRLNERLDDSKYLFGDTPTLADMGTVTFVRQYANVDRTWFDAQPWPHLLRWLVDFLESARFAAIMQKHKPWADGDTPKSFPE